MLKGEASDKLAARIARLNFIYQRTGDFPPLPEPPRVESRCGIVCSECSCECDGRAKGCISIPKPFHGMCEVKACCESKKLLYCSECPEFPCDLLNKYAYDPAHGDEGKRIKQCSAWLEAEKKIRTTDWKKDLK